MILTWHEGGRNDLRSTSPKLGNILQEVVVENFLIRKDRLKFQQDCCASEAIRECELGRRPGLGLIDRWTKMKCGFVVPMLVIVVFYIL